MLKRTDLTTPDLEELDRLLDLDPDSLTYHDKQVLKARRDYLTKDQQRIFESVLNEKHEQPKEEAEPVKEEVATEPATNVFPEDEKK
jgi:hypothetical protein